MDNIVKHELLSSIYFNSNHSFLSILKLYSTAKALNQNITLEDVKRFLKNTLTYSSFKPIHKRNNQWQLRLLVLPDLNGGYVNTLVVIDCFSKLGYMQLMRSKKASEVLKAFIIILKRSKVKPQAIQTDLSAEFKGVFSRFLKRNNIYHFSISLELECAGVVRFSRVLENRVFGCIQKHDQWWLNIIKIPKLNRGYSYILVAIDSFSKEGFAELMRNNKASNTLFAFESILKRSTVKPRLILTDFGSQYSGVFKKFLRTNGIHLFSSNIMLR